MESASHAPLSSGAGTPAAVLVVEDVPLLQMATAALVQVVCGAVPKVAANGYEAVVDMLRADFDLVLMDVDMPVMDGIAAVGLMRIAEETGGRRRAPIVAYTSGVAGRIDRAALLEAGFDDALQKPATDIAIAACIERWRHGRPVARGPCGDAIVAVLVALEEAASCRAVAAILRMLDGTSPTRAERHCVTSAMTSAHQRIYAADRETVARANACLRESRAFLASTSATFSRPLPVLPVVACVTPPTSRMPRL